MHSKMNATRRQWISTAALTSVGAVLWSTRPRRIAAAEKKEIPVPAVEDLMREHGVLRRALLVYDEASARLSRAQEDVPARLLRQTAQLFRSFGEDYHERSLEEKHVFPLLTKAGGEQAALVKTLVAQHNRGREITDYITAVTRSGQVPTAARAPLAKALSSFTRMYQHHAAIEDTVIFPAWKKILPPSEYEELSEQFEELEHQLFGDDGFDDAAKRVAEAERAFGLADLNALTAPAPPESNR